METKRVDDSNSRRVVLGVVGELGGVHYWHEDGGVNGRLYGGVEVHWREKPRWTDQGPDRQDCWLLKGPCWHDGSSLYADEVFIPLWKECDEAGDMEPLWLALEREYRDRFCPATF